MNFEKTDEDLTIQLPTEDEKTLVQKIYQKYDELEDDRRIQLDDIKLVRNAIYTNQVPQINGWDSNIELPDIYELAQTLKSHISDNLYSHPDAMFDVSGVTPQSQAFANRQKALLVNTFEQMKLEDELEKVIDGIVETGESTLFVGWETKIKSIRRAQSIEEQLIAPTQDGFVIENQLIYDNPKVKYIKPEDFVFDKNRRDSWDSCTKIYRTYLDVEEISANKANNLLDEVKIEILKGVVADKTRKETDKSVCDNRLEILEYWGDIELTTGEILKNWLIVTAGRREVIRFEANPFIINPFIHANIIENPSTGRGLSPLRVALILNNISSTILNKQVDALALMMNPPYLAPKGCFKGEQVVKPGKIIEYDSSLMPTAPSPLSFEKALHGWDFLNYFKTTIESATGIFKNMAGNIQTAQRTATELNYSVSGQTTRLNMMLDAINRKIIIPMVEKTAELIANFKIGREVISVFDQGKTLFIEIDDTIRNAKYIYRYGDRKATLERKLRSKELFDVIRAFAEVPTMTNQINWIECFKFALEQYGIENANNFLVESNGN
ncbi:MAG TPA: hypothetical protein PLG15_00155 [Candidatus Gastranaerophilaceae bacterium]|nr:hypothetical protein [Candidatus Gastranaerophilaceae bacterium]